MRFPLNTCNHSCWSINTSKLDLLASLKERHKGWWAAIVLALMLSCMYSVHFYTEMVARFCSNHPSLWLSFDENVTERQHTPLQIRRVCMYRYIR